MKVKNLIVATVLVATIFGCGKEDDKVGAASDADGTWSSACDSDGNGGYSKVVSVISGGMTVDTSGTYSDAACLTAVSLMAMTRTFIVGNAVAAPAGAKELYTKATSLTLTYKTDAQVTAANAANICGGGFVKDQPKVVSSTDCKDTLIIKEMFDEIFNVYKVDGNKLYVGECGEDGTATDCTAATKRPTTLDDSFLTKS
jgi:hypothetical protein